MTWRSEGTQAAGDAAEQFDFGAGGTEGDARTRGGFRDTRRDLPLSAPLLQHARHLCFGTSRPSRRKRSMLTAAY